MTFNYSSGFLTVSPSLSFSLSLSLFISLSNTIQGKQQRKNEACNSACLFPFFIHCENASVFICLLVLLCSIVDNEI